MYSGFVNRSAGASRSTRADAPFDDSGRRFVSIESVAMLSARIDYNAIPISSWRRC